MTETAFQTSDQMYIHSRTVRTPTYFPTVPWNPWTTLCSAQEEKKVDFVDHDVRKGATKLTTWSYTDVVRSNTECVGTGSIYICNTQHNANMCLFADIYTLHCLLLATLVSLIGLQCWKSFPSLQMCIQLLKLYTCTLYTHVLACESSDVVWYCFTCFAWSRGWVALLYCCCISMHVPVKRRSL